MTDEQIEKALECCSKAPTELEELYEACANCPYNEQYHCACELATDALALIKRQREKIEKLIDECGSQSVLWRDHFAGIYETGKESIKAEARTEAIREFEKAVMELFPSDKKFTTISRASIMQIAREMTEEQE